MKRFLNTVMALIFPPKCVGCRRCLPLRSGEAQSPLCPECEGEWQRELRHSCPKCFAPYCECHCMPSVMRRAGCADYIKLAAYGEGDAYRVLRALVLDMKRTPRRSVQRFVVDEWQTELEQSLTRLGIEKEQVTVTYLPRTARNLRRDGTDQARELAVALSARLGVPFQRLIARNRRSKVQKSLNAKQRMANLDSALSRYGVPVAPCVILVDDLVTTGAGMSVATKLLREAGAETVIALSIGYTERQKRTRD